MANQHQKQRSKMFSLVSCRRINPAKIHSERITKKDKELANDLDYDGIQFPVSEIFFIKLKRKTTFASMFFVMKTN